ncbi:polyhydroxyalkanoate depolymerase [Hyphomonas adhaerens MHS-3]|jgi:poly(3-hydroxybutyrate) depolymerase|uniref:Polyhydroxyalkanoate depolymerase n=2 Tax=Hyphomonas adhaerens TaxID=81029 RepID=A0A069E8R7_9PROT|nr:MULTISPECIES: polyhydroxyalkanoate depolymerase [Hyphomonas]KCZ84601.1 polyhydroxyalkanoate depolymerase [Hyphomonas adhaerens MHS-3]MBB39710.1 polyhydroxyalkanoate depolymerase [Hyphomonas sp.]|tara:strand:+ start:6873 stop:8159 length:1287 start_codon:yes stop_codon:yes gene_type:complete
MLYSFVEMNRAAMAPMRMAVRAGRMAMHSSINPIAKTEYGKALTAFADVFESATRYYGKPEWGIESVKINSAPVPVTPTVAWRSPWCNMVHFRKDPDALAFARKPGAAPLPRMLIVAPLSGHYATLLRGTVEGFLETHDVYIADWSDARMAPVWLGRFDLDDYMDHVRKMISHIGPGAHVLAVCQPGPPVLAAISMMAEDDDPNRPASMTFMGSPIDTRRSPTVPNELAEEQSFEWFQENMIYTVPGPYPGVFRRVYPGFVQLASFMNMNWGRHVDAQWRFFNHLVEGDGDNAGKHREFYDEYLSVLDMTEEFYLQTILRVFQEHHLPRGIMKYRYSRQIRPEKIRDVALMTVEGEKDDISGIGQTQAAHDLCTQLPKEMQLDYIQPGVGHYGVFNGNRFRTEIAPRVTEFTRRFTHRELDEAALDKV